MAEQNILLHHSKTQDTPPKLLSKFLYKSILAFLFIALLPLFPSQAPDFLTNTIFTRSWELLHLLIVGIAISYGLFSRRNAEVYADKDLPSKPDSPNSYISRFLHVSSIFDEDDADIILPSVSPEDGKIQSWSSHYYKNEPLVVSVAEEGYSTSEKPLSLPVRGFKHFDSSDGITGSSSSRAAPKVYMEEELKETVVLPSPIPWRSRSGRLEEEKDVSGEGDDATTFLPSAAIETDLNGFSSSSLRSCTRKKLSPSPSLSPELRAKTGEDLMKRKKSFPSSSPPPPPPPPPPPSSFGHSTKPSFKYEHENNNLPTDPLVSELKPRNVAQRVHFVGKSVRTIRPKEDIETKMQQRLPNEQVEKLLADSEDSNSDEDEADAGESSAEEGGAPEPVAEAVPDENEVDKKADEFIAKFREQIRLQRIESIKQSSGQRTSRNLK